MGDGYTRQSAADIVTGNVVEAGPLNAEFNQIRDAFQESSGHSHDGTVGEGPKISLTTSISGVLPVANGGFAGIHKVNATTAPVAADDSGDGYAVGSVWLDTTNDKAYICVDSTLGAAIWQLIGASTGWQPLDTDLTAIAALTSAANKVPYSTGAGTWALADFSAFGRSIVDDADAAALLTTLGITPTVTELNYVDGVTSAIQTQLDAKQALDADLTALAALSGTNTIYYRSAANTWTAVTIGGNLTFSAGTLDAVASSLDATLTAMAGVTTAADTGIYFTGVDVAASYTLTSFARTLLDDATAGAALTTLGVSAFAQTILDDTTQAAVRTTLGLTPGTDVQAYDADLTAVAGLASNGLIARTGAGTASVRTLTAPAAGITVSNGDGVSGNPTLALANDLAALEALAGTDTLYYRSGSDTWTAVTIGSGITFSGGTLSASGGYTAIAAVATTSGTGTTGKTLNFPAGTKKITFMCNGISSSAAADAYIRLGDSGGAESSGYSGYGIQYTGSIANYSSSTSQFSIGTLAAASVTITSTIELTLMDSSTNKWQVTISTVTDNTYSYFLVGSKALSAELTTVTLYFASGNFDAGSVSAVYSL